VEDLEADRAGQRQPETAAVLDQPGADEVDQVVVPGCLQDRPLLGDRRSQIGVQRQRWLHHLLRLIPGQPGLAPGPDRPVDDGETGDQVGTVGGQLEGGRGTPRVARDDHPAEAELGDQRGRIGGQRAWVVAVRRSCRAAVRPLVERHQPAVRQVSGEATPKGGV